MRHQFGLSGFVAVLAFGFTATGPAGASDPLYPQRDWGKFSGGEMNSSVLVFRDINRNGVYDLGDRPMPNVAVELGRPDGSTSLERTNVSGFANFPMSVLKRDREITDPGHYVFQVMPPPGWSVTTGNAKQESDYIVTPGAPGDIIARKTTHPVGLAADLSIGGTASAGTKVTFTGPDGITRAVEANADGYFSIAASPGTWQVETLAERREVTVDRAPVILAAFSGKGVGESGAAPLPKSRVVGFDDLLTTSGVLEVPVGYGGLDWYNVVAMHQRFTGGPGYINTGISSEFIAYNSSGHPATISSRKPFDFVGVYVGAGWEDAEGETLLVKAWRGEDLAYQDSLTLSAMGARYFAADYRRITRIEIRTAHYWQAVLDDFAYRTQD